MKAWRGLRYATDPEVYDPSDDTFLLAGAVADLVGPEDRFLEVGTGSGLVAMAAARVGARVVATDLNPGAVRLARHNARANDVEADFLQADLLASLRGPFDVIAFNPPYLPTGPSDAVHGPLNLAFDGGPDGNEVVLRFVGQLRDLRSRPREVLVVHSDVANPGPLVAAMGGLGYDCEVVAEERHFFEAIAVRSFVASRCRSSCPGQAQPTTW